MLVLLKSRRGVSGLEYMAIAVLVMTGILLGGPYVMRAINAPFKAIEEGAIDSSREDIKQGNGVLPPPVPCACTPLAFSGCGNGTGGCSKTQELWRRTCVPLGCEVDLIASGIITVMQECHDNPTNTCCLDPVSTGNCGALATHVPGGCPAGQMEVKKMCGSPTPVAVYACLPDAACTNDCQPYGSNVVGWCDPLHYKDGVVALTPPVLVANGHCNDDANMKCKAECVAGAYVAGGGCLLQCTCAGDCASNGWDCGTNLCGQACGPLAGGCPVNWTCKDGHHCFDCTNECADNGWDCGNNSCGQSCNPGCSMCSGHTCLD